MVLWNRDPKDFGSVSAEPLQRWFREAPLAGGDVVLLHDTHAGIAPGLDAAAERAAQLGLRLGSIGDWLGRRSGGPAPGGVDGA